MQQAEELRKQQLAQAQRDRQILLEAQRLDEQARWAAEQQQNQTQQNANLATGFATQRGPSGPAGPTSPFGPTIAVPFANGQNNKFGFDMNNWQPSATKTNQEVFRGINYTKDPSYSKTVEAMQKYTEGYQNVDGMNAEQKQDTITMLRGIPYTRVDKDKFNEAVSNTSMGLAGVALLVPGGQGVAAASLTIGSAITLGNNILYEVVYSDGTTKDKVTYVAKEALIEAITRRSGLKNIGKNFVKFWEDNLHLLNYFPKSSIHSLEDIKKMGIFLDMFQGQGVEIFKEKTIRRKD